MKYRSSKPNEYFIVENRSKMGLDRSLPSSGLAVYHCDIFGSNELQQGTASQHYQCALLQADGRRDLENNPQNQGDSEDLFPLVAGTALTSLTNPHSREWDNRDSGLIISNISAPGGKIQFQVGATSPALVASKESTPDLEIPDNQFGGVSDTIQIEESGIVRRIKVEVDISHTYIGDLLVQLVSPTGARELLHARQGGTQEDLSLSFDSDHLGELSNFVGRPMMGAWILNISDREGADEGKLDKWKIEIESAVLV